MKTTFWLDVIYNDFILQSTFDLLLKYLGQYFVFKHCYIVQVSAIIYICISIARYKGKKIISTKCGILEQQIMKTNETRVPYPYILFHFL